MLALITDTEQMMRIEQEGMNLRTLVFCGTVLVGILVLAGVQLWWHRRREA